MVPAHAEKKNALEGPVSGTKVSACEATPCNAVMENASGGRKGTAEAMFVLGQLKPPYDEFFQQKSWDRYVAALNEEGLAWWFNMDIPVLAAHLVPLASASHYVAIPPRLQFLSEAVNMTATPEILETYYRQFVDHGDLDAAAVAAGTVVMSVWEVGRGFDCLADWHIRIKNLLALKGSLSALAIAALWHYKCVIDQSIESNHNAVIESAEKAMAWSKRAGANNLRIHISLFHLHARLWNAQFDELESTVSDAKALCDIPDLDLPAKSVLLSHVGIYEMIKGNIEKSRIILKRMLDSTAAAEFTTFLKMMIHNHAILHAAYLGDIAELKILSRKIQAFDYPVDMSLHSSFFHYSLGMVFLNTKEPEKANLHLKLAEKSGEGSGSLLPVSHIPLLRGQILSDKGEFDAAEKLLCSWQVFWKDNGHNLYLIASEVEIANILIQIGKKEKSRKRYTAARSLWPLQSPIYAFARSAAFVQKIESALFSACEAADIRPAEAAQPIHIQTFGELKVHMGSGAIYDRQWKGTRLKQLLKALIVLGAADVPAERLIRLLWPDTDNAAASLKAAVWRLRRLGCEKDDDPPPWIRLQNRRVSLSPALCRVDAVQFRTQLAAALSDGDDIDRLRAALDLYTDDFLKNDVNDPWIVRHRDALKSEFTSGALALTDRCEKMDCTEAALPYLEKAIDRRPPDGDLYARLMTGHIRMGEPSKAHQIYRRAEDALGGDQDVDRSAELRRLAALLGN